MRYPIATILLLIITMTGCQHFNSSHDHETISVISNGTWRVEDLNGAGVIDRSRTNLHFSSDGLLSGLAGCNSYSTTYTLDQGTLQIGTIALTRKACIPALADQEQRFIGILQEAERLSIDSTGALSLHTSDKRYLLARRIP